MYPKIISEKIENRDFKGMWYPKQLYFFRIPETMKKIYLEIYSFSNNDKNCFLSNEYFSELLDINTNSVSEYITQLKYLELIEQTEFDGRKRYLKVIKNPEDINEQYVRKILQKIETDYSNILIDNGINQTQGKPLGRLKENLKSDQRFFVNLYIYYNNIIKTNNTSFYKKEDKKDSDESCSSNTFISDKQKKAVKKEKKKSRLEDSYEENKDLLEQVITYYNSKFKNNPVISHAKDSNAIKIGITEPLLYWINKGHVFESFKKAINKWIEFRREEHSYSLPANPFNLFQIPVRTKEGGQLKNWFEDMLSKAEVEEDQVEFVYKSTEQEDIINEKMNKAGGIDENFLKKAYIYSIKCQDRFMLRDRIDFANFRYVTPTYEVFLSENRQNLYLLWFLWLQANNVVDKEQLPEDCYYYQSFFTDKLLNLMIQTFKPDMLKNEKLYFGEK